MAEKAKTSQRDATLVNVLERMADHLQNQDQLLGEILDRQQEISKSMESIEFQRFMRQDESESGYEKLLESFTRYRSDMLRLVNEQDRMSKGMSDFSSRAVTIAYATENTDQKAEDLRERFKIQEKTVRDHYEHALRQAVSLPKEITDSYRDVAKLHMETEKRLGQLHSETQQLLAESNRNVAKQHVETEKRLVQLHNETQRQLDKSRAETLRRLMALDGIESALQTLLIRTEPPEKKPLLIIRIFRPVGRVIRKTLTSISRRIRSVRKDKDSE